MAGAKRKPVVVVSSSQRAMRVPRKRIGQLVAFVAEAEGRDVVERVDRSGSALCDPWPLRTQPSPDSRPEFVRVLAYTCAGGRPDHGGDAPWFLPLAVRRRLLRRALSFRPQAVIAIGDHVYWDQRSALEHRNREYARSTRAYFERVGWLDRSLPVLGTRNEASLKAAVGPQISELYGVLLRSTPSYFVCAGVGREGSTPILRATNRP